MKKTHATYLYGDSHIGRTADEFSRSQLPILALYRSVGNHDEGGSDSGRKEQGSR
jgi:hypothetical protein